MSLDAFVKELVAAEVSRRIAEVQRPDHVTQRTVLAIVGMPARDYLRHARDGDWPSWSDRRLRYARTADVVAWIESHPVPHVASNDGDAETRAFARSRSGIRRIA